MADGSRQTGFNFPRKVIASALRPGEIILDFFAGGGGASEALRQALGRDPDVAVNHDHLAISMHAANHPFTRHMEADVWTVDILREVNGRQTGWFHSSPDCTHFSQAKGGQPRDRATRSLSWVVMKVCGKLARHGIAPRILSLENVEQILKWGPLVAKRDKSTGRVVRLDGTVAAKGERVPLREQFLIPDKRHAGRTWRQFVGKLRALGYDVQWRKLTASDYGAGTSRTRLFMLARRDGLPIVWPEPTHGPGRPNPFVTAADCIDWSVPCQSIFERKRPLADATCRRIAKGIQRYVLDAADPFIVPCGEMGGSDMPQEAMYAHSIHRRPEARRAHRGFADQAGDAASPGSTGGPVPALVRPQELGNGRKQPVGARAGSRTGVRMGRSDGAGVSGTQHCRGATAGARSGFLTEHANASNQRTFAADTPLRTQCAGVKGGHFAVVSPVLAGVGGRAGQTEPRSADEPLYTVTSKGDCAITTATLVQTGYGERPGQGPRVPGLHKPLGTLVDGQKHAAVSAHLIKFRGDSSGNSVEDPLPTITSGAGAARPAGAAHAMGVITAHLTAMAQNVSAVDPEKPLPTILAGATRFGLVSAFLEQANGGGENGNPARARAAEEPVSSITGTGSQQRLATAHLAKLRGTSSAADATDPVATISAGGEHHAVVECTLSDDQLAGAERVAAFLMRYHGTGGQHAQLADPLTTVTTKDRLALVTVTIKGTPYVIVDIGLRMLRREELYRAQGFPADYIIDRTADGRPLSISASVRMVGNSVSPPPLAAIARANLDPVDASLAVAA